MAAWSTRFFRTARQLYLCFKPLVRHTRFVSCVAYNTFPRFSLLGVAVLAQVLEERESQECDDVKTPYSEKIIHDAVVNTINSSTSLLTVVIAELLRTEKQHFAALGSLLQFQECNLVVLGDRENEDKALDLIVKVRAEVASLAARCQELEELFACSVRTLRSAAETAHTAGAEYVAIAASERIHSAESELSRIQKQSRQIKTEIASVEAAIIERTMELEKQREAEAEQNATSNDEDESVTKVKEEPVDDDYETATAMEGS